MNDAVAGDRKRNPHGQYSTLLPRSEWFIRPDGLLVDTERPRIRGTTHFNWAGEVVGYKPFPEPSKPKDHPYYDDSYCRWDSIEHKHIKEPLEARVGRRYCLRINGTPLDKPPKKDRRGNRLGKTTGKAQRFV